MSGYKNLAVNTALFAANAVATRLMTFLLVPLYTYYMSAGEYGITDMSLTVISLVTPLATLAVADAAVRFIIEDDSRKSEYAFIGFVVTLLSILIVAMLTPALDLDVFGGLGKHKVFFLFAYSSSAFLQLCSEVARGMGEIKTHTHLLWDFIDDNRCLCIRPYWRLRHDGCRLLYLSVSRTIGRYLCLPHGWTHRGTGA